MKALARIEKYIGQILKAKRNISQNEPRRAHTDMTHCALECVKRRQGQKDAVRRSRYGRGGGGGGFRCARTSGN